jgi:hypothetical protein
MRKLPLISALGFAIANVALASPNRPVTVLAPSHNPVGALGFQQYCSSTFPITNLLLQSQSFTTSPWAVNGAGGSSAPTVTANSTVAPDGATTASTLALASVSGAGAGSYLYQPITGLSGGHPITEQIWVKGAAGGETIWLSVSPDGSGTLFARQKIVATTNWMRYTFTWYPVSGVQYLEAGVDLRDGSQSAQAGQSVYIWGAQAATGQRGWPYILTTTAAVTANIPQDCPPGVAFRDFGQLAANPGNPITSQNTGAYNSGGVSNPYVRSWSKIGGTYYGIANCIASGAPRAAFQWNQCLYTGSGPLNWTDTGAGNPIISNTLGSWDDHYLLHGAWSPTCSVATYCYYYSAMDSGNNSAIGLATSSNGVTWAKVGSVITNPLLPSLPTLIQVGSTLRMFTAINNNSGTVVAHWTSATSDGLTWAYNGEALYTPTALDWDNGGGYIDSFVIRNKHGFFEMAYTSMPANVKIGLAVSADTINWWKYQAAPIISNQSKFYPGTLYLGDIVFFEDNTQFYVTANYDDGTTTSNGIGGIIPGR